MLMRMRQLCLFMLALGLALLPIAGCGKHNQPVPSPSPSTDEPAKAHANSVRSHSVRMRASIQSNTMMPSPYPASIAVIVNKNIYLPRDYKPKDLVYPNVPFLFEERIEKRQMRQEAATALERMFAGAKKDGIGLSGVSAYRPYYAQQVLFEKYVRRDGYEKAKTYSALPGTSEHQTGLAIDVSGDDGACAVSSCFGYKKEAQWLAKHSVEYGFIVRYPKGKEHITGYKYEPWHMRYVGPSAMAKDMKSRGITLEEYFGVYPASK